MISLLVFSLTTGISGCSAQDAPQEHSTIYDPNPRHLWNRLNETPFDRTVLDRKHFGLDELDILYWQSTKNVLVEPSQQQALAVLDEFIKTHGEKLIFDPLKRAWLQRDLWELAPVESAREAQAAIYWKQRQFDWGLFQGLWRQTE